MLKRLAQGRVMQPPDHVHGSTLPRLGTVSFATETTPGAAISRTQGFGRSALGNSSGSSSHGVHQAGIADHGAKVANQDDYINEGSDTVAWSVKVASLLQHNASSPPLNRTTNRKLSGGMQAMEPSRQSEESPTESISGKIEKDVEALMRVFVGSAAEMATRNLAHSSRPVVWASNALVPGASCSLPEQLPDALQLCEGRSSDAKASRRNSNKVNIHRSWSNQIAIEMAHVFRRRSVPWLPASQPTLFVFVRTQRGSKPVSASAPLFRLKAIARMRRASPSTPLGIPSWNLTVASGTALLRKCFDLGCDRCVFAVNRRPLQPRSHEESMAAISATSVVASTAASGYQCRSYGATEFCAPSSQECSSCRAFGMPVVAVPVDID